MSTLLNYIKSPNNKGLFWWIKYYWNEFLITIYQKKTKPMDDSWKSTIKVSKTEFPEGLPKEAKFAYYLNGVRNKNKVENDKAFEFLGKEYSGIMFKRFKD